MLYAFKIGPVETEEGVFSFYFTASEGELGPVVTAANDAEGLREIAHRAGSGTLQCEPSLARVGRRLGFVPAPMPEWLALPMASLALGVGLGPLVLESIGFELLLDFAKAAAGFCRAGPWRSWHSGQPIAVSVTGSVARGYEGCIVGNAGEEYGVALYEQPGAIARIEWMMEQGRIREAAGVDSLAVMLDGEPAFAAEACARAVGISVVPVPVRFRGGKALPVAPEELVLLIAVLRAASRLSAKRRTAVAEAAGQGTRVEVRLQAPAPEGRPPLTVEHVWEEASPPGGRSWSPEGRARRDGPGPGRSRRPGR